MANPRFIPPAKATLQLTPLETRVALDALEIYEPPDPEEHKAINRVRSRLALELVRIGKAKVR